MAQSPLHMLFPVLFAVGVQGTKIYYSGESFLWVICPRCEGVHKLFSFVQITCES